MGSSLSSVADEIGGKMQAGMKKSMADNQQSMMNAQMEMAMRRREVQMAVNIAWSRDLLLYIGSFTGTLALVGTALMVKKGNPAGLIPVFPLSFVCAYQYDMGYGTKMNRIQAEAGRILDEEWRKGDNNRFLLPPNNVLMSRQKYEYFTRREEQSDDDNTESIQTDQPSE